VTHFSIIAYVKSRKEENNIELVPTPDECRAVSGVTDGVHRAVDEQDKMIAGFMLVLHVRQRIEQTFPLGIVRVYVWNPYILEKTPNLRAGQASFGVSQNTTGSFKVL
jgi:hypothetical protein